MQHRQQKSIVHFIERIILYTGLSELTKAKKILQWTAKFAIFCFITTSVTQIITLVTAKDEPEKLFECFSIFSFCGMGLLKLHSLYSNRKIWKSLLDKVSKMEIEELESVNKNAELEFDIIDDYFLNYIQIYTKKFVFISTVLSRLYSFTGIIFILSPFIETEVRKLRNIEFAQYPHILPGWSPLDDYNIIGYLTTVLFEVIAAIYCVCVHISFDLISVGLMIFVCGQFDLLRDYSMHIGGSSTSCSVSEKRDVQARRRIKHCYRIHNLTAALVSELDILLKNILGFYFFIATLTLCSVAVRLKSEQLSTMELLSLLQYMGASLMQLFLYCHYGDDVIYKSSTKVGEGPFESAWWALSPKVRRELMLLAYGMSRPCQLRAGFFHLLYLPSFVQIVKTAYSYYAVLGQKSQ